MSNTAGPVYEVTVSVDRDVVEQFDAWLRRHMAETLELPGIARAEVFEQDDDERGRARRITQYHFDSEADFDEYLSEHRETAWQAAADLCAGGLESRDSVMRPSDIAGHGPSPAESCLNCGTRLSGQYCGNCGQRAASRLISIWELLRDAFGDLFELDSRLWRTLIPLTTRPGKLTRDYLLGRRARYMPPFRMYLVLSIVFFLLAFFDPREKLGVLFEPPAPTEEGADATGDGESAGTRSGIVFSVDGEPDENCELEGYDASEMPDWLASRLTRERLTVMCNRIVADDGRAFLRELADNVPAALFILLPLMALVLKLLYPLSRRYYVEHLLFVVHFHAFVFLVLTVEVLLGRLGLLLRAPDLPIDVFTFALSVYVPVYLYKAQRRVYEQGRFATVLKFLLLVLAYLAGLFVMLAVVAIFAAFTF